MRPNASPYDWTSLLDLLTDEEIEALSPKASSGTPVWGYWRGFVGDWRLSRRSELTIRNVRDALRLFATQGNLLTIEDWNDTQKAFREMHRMGKERNWSPSTFNTYRKNANTFFRHLRNMGAITEAKVTNIPKMNAPKKGYAIPAKEDFAKIGEYLKTRPCTNELERKRNLLFFLLMMITGVRPKELLGMSLKNFDNRNHMKIDSAKNGAPRSCVLPEVAKIALTEYVRESAKAGRDKELDKNVFLSTKGRNPWTYAGVRKLLERVNKESGTSVPVTCYSFRRNAATALFVDGTPIEEIAKLLGHSRMSMTMAYVQNVAEINKHSVEALSNKFGGLFA